MGLIWGILSLVLCVFLGVFIVFQLKNTNEQKVIKPLLAFSGGFLLSIAFIHFIPEIYGQNTESIGGYILLGFLVQLVLEFFTGGVEHGHIHVDKSMKLPWGLILGLSVHSILEGIPLYAQLSLGQESVGVHGHSNSAFFVAVILHKIPEAIALCTLLLKSKMKKPDIWMIMFAFAIMSPVGIFLGYFFPFGFHSTVTDILLAIVIGMFLHISTTIIFETAEDHRFNWLKLSCILAGVFSALMMH